MLDFDEKSVATTTCSADMILDYVHENDLTVEWIFDAHPHADHFSAAGYLCNKAGVPTGIGEHVLWVQALWKQIYNMPALPADGSLWNRHFKDSERFQIGRLDVKLIYSPGHTPASITLVIGDAAFIHDTIFIHAGFGHSASGFPRWERVHPVELRSEDSEFFRTKRAFSRDMTIDPELAKLAGRAPWRNRNDRTRISRKRG